MGVHFDVLDWNSQSHMVINNLDTISNEHTLIVHGNLKMEFKIEDTDLTDFLFCVYDLSILPQDFVQSYLYLDHIE